MVKKIEDKDFEKFLTDGYYAVIGFYHEGAANKQEMFDMLEQFSDGHAGTVTGVLDIAGSSVADDYGVDEDISPVVVVFKSQNPIKVMTEFDLEELSGTITPPGANITLQ
jgi:hypothetical protein